MAKKANKRSQSNLMVRLFFAPFLLFGLGLLVLAGLMTTRHLASQSWQPVQAKLLERGVEQNASDDSESARSTGKFSYQWQGRSYQSTRLSFSKMMTSDQGIKPDDWDERIARALDKPGGTITAWVDPANPASAVVLRDMRWLEMGIYVILGLLLIASSSPFLFGYDPHKAKHEFSWRTVIVMWIVGLPLTVLTPLLWRDAHQVWTAVSVLPLLLAIVGTANGLRLAKARSSSEH